MEAWRRIEADRSALREAAAEVRWAEVGRRLRALLGVLVGAAAGLWVWLAVLPPPWPEGVRRALLRYLGAALAGLGLLGLLGRAFRAGRRPRPAGLRTRLRLPRVPPGVVEETFAAVRSVGLEIPRSWWGPAPAVVLRLLEAHERLPASASYHDADPGGLLRHSLDALRAALGELERLAAEALEARVAVTVLLGHDLGKLETVQERDGKYVFREGHERRSAVLVAHALLLDPEVPPEAVAAASWALVAPRRVERPPGPGAPLVDRLRWLLRAEYAAVDAGCLIREALDAGGPPVASDAGGPKEERKEEEEEKGLLPPGAARALVPDRGGLKVFFGPDGRIVRALLSVRALEQAARAAGRDAAAVVRAVEGRPGVRRAAGGAWTDEAGRRTRWSDVLVLERSALDALSPETRAAVEAYERRPARRTPVEALEVEESPPDGGAPAPAGPETAEAEAAGPAAGG